MRPVEASATNPIDMAISRRRALQLAGAAGAAAFLASARASRVARAQSAAVKPTSGLVRMNSWIGYIDIGPDNNHPSLDRFTAETGISIEYLELIVDNEDFFASDLQPNIQAGVSTGWDIAVLTDWMVQRLVDLGWLESIDTSGMTNYPANLGDIYRTREWDPGNTFAAPFQSGMTGLGFDKNVTGEQTNLDVLFSDQFAQHMTYLTDLRDTVGLSALRLGIDPATINQDQWEAALEPIRLAQQNEWVRHITGQGYVEDMAAGNVVIATAWSGDIWLLIPDQKPEQDFQWRLADQGGMLWTDNMVIPLGAENKAQAQVFIDWYYDPRNAAEIEVAANYVCPVKGSNAVLLASDPEIASNTLIFPTPEMFAQLHEFRALDFETATAWESEFNDIIGV